MNCYKAPGKPIPKERVKHPPKVDGDELCGTPDCNHQRRKHIFDRSCGEYPCACNTFIQSGRMYDWKNQLVPDVRLGERAAANLKEIRSEQFEMMTLQQTIANSEFDDKNRFDFLVGVHQHVSRMDEVHPSENDDWNYVYLIWLNGNAEPESFIRAMYENLRNASDTWHFHAESVGDLIIVQCHP